MSHIDDGMLHAYLDGALDEYPAAEAARVREHLEACGECRDRLEAERAIRNRAASILGATVPRVDVPTLEELRSYARAADSRSSAAPSRLQRLGWAASIAVALGTGWILRGERIDRSASVAVSVPAERSATVGDASAAPEPAARDEAEDRTDAPPEPNDAVTAAPAPVRLEDDVLLPSRTPLPSIEVDVAGATVDPGTEDVVAALEASPPPLPEAPRLEDTIGPRVLTPDLLVDATDSGRRRAATSDRGSDGDRIATSANAAAAAPGIDGLVPTLRLEDVAEARSGYVEDEEASYSLVVPGLEVLEVRFRGVGSRPEGQVALQRLESGDTLRVIHLPEEVGLSSLDVPSGEVRQIVLQTGSGWIVMRARASNEELLTLMRRLLSAK